MKQTSKPKDSAPSIDQLTREAFAKFDTKKRNMLIALVNTMGIVTEAAKQARIHPSSHYNWINKESHLFDPEYKKQVDTIGNISLDFAESRLFDLISGVRVKSGRNTYTQPPNVAAVIFYLKTKGKGRGYVEKQLIGFDPDDESEIESTLAI